MKLKVFGEQLQSSCRRVNFDLTVLDSKRTFHRVFDCHCLDIKHIDLSDKFVIMVYKKCPVTDKTKILFSDFFLGILTNLVRFSIKQQFS